MAVQVLGVSVSAELAARWSDWLAPQSQPFYLHDLGEFGLSSQASSPPGPEIRDTLQLYRLQGELSCVWLNEEEFACLPRVTRTALVRAQLAAGRGGVPTVQAWADLVDPVLLKAQADGHRFVWWPSLLASSDVQAILTRFVSTRRLTSRHGEVPKSVWKDCAGVLPGAEELAGTFPDGSGPNCFGTVMAAAGVAGAEEEWVQDQPFEAWLGGATRPGGEDRLPGTVLVWRDQGGIPRHAAATLGDGWAMEKPSQDWHSPRTVLGLTQLKAANRVPGLRLARHSLLR